MSQQFSAQVTWMDRKGAGRMRHFSNPDQLASFLDNLRTEATIRNSQGEKIGAVQWAPDLFDDGRRCWAWHFEQDGMFSNWQEL